MIFFVQIFSTCVGNGKLQNFHVFRHFVVTVRRNKIYLFFCPYYPAVERNTVGYATTNNAYNKQFLSIKSGCYNEHRCYNERGEILSADVARACAWRVGPSLFD